MKLEEIIKIINADYNGKNEDKEIKNVAKIEEAKSDEITFLSNPLYEKYIHSTNAGAVLVKKDYLVHNIPSGLDVLYVDDPYLSFLSLISLFNKDSDESKGISDKSFIDTNSNIAEDVYIGNFTSIGKNFHLGKNSVIHSNCSIGNDVQIGENCLIYPNVSIYDGSKIGNRVIIHSGSVIGSDGFGFAKQPDGVYKKIPQKGIVVIDDDVEIGSNTSIDKATIGMTYIGKGVKIDNLVQIAHNVTIGENSIIVSQSGIAGSTKIGKRCILAGKVGMIGHLELCDDVIITAGTNVTKSILKPGTYTGYRAKEIHKSMKEDAFVSRLEDLFDRLKKLENKF